VRSLILAQAGAGSYETQRIGGQWRYAGVVYSDTLVKIVVEVADTISNRRWMRAYRDRWRERPGQIELWMVRYVRDIE
jgi:hypothetical protein